MTSAKGFIPPEEHEGRKGFLPIETNLFDRVFISLVLLVAIHLFWMRFVESVLPIWIATLISLIMGAVIVTKG